MFLAFSAFVCLVFSPGTRDTLRRDPTWLLAAIRDLSVLQLKRLMECSVPVNLYTDATPHSVAAMVPSMRTSVPQVFVNTEEINRTEPLPQS